MVPTSTARRVSGNALLAIYGIAPLSVAIILFDHFCRGGALRSSLPHSPESLAWFLVLFVNPHILASLLSFANREYLRHYGQDLLLGTALIASGLALIPHYFGARALEFCLALWTIQHSASQLTGIAGWMLKERRAGFLAWKGIFTAQFVLFYFFIYRTASLPTGDGQPSGKVIFASVVLCLLGTVSAALAAGLRPRAIGSRFLWANQIMSGAVLVCYALGYPFFSILILRLVHDLTAFAFYLVHEYNRTLSAGNHFLYHALEFTGVPVVYLVLLLSIGLAFALVRIGQPWAFQLLALSGPMHYFVEAKIWKQGAPHRRYALSSW